MCWEKFRCRRLGSLWDEDLEVAFVASLVAKFDEGWEEMWGRISGVSSFCNYIPEQQQSAVIAISKYHQLQQVPQWHRLQCWEQC